MYALGLTKYAELCADRRLPILVGEFGHVDVDEDTVMATSEALDIGYIGWSWSGNTDPVLDMVLNFDIANLTAWGEHIINGANGIAETAGWPNGLPMPATTRATSESSGCRAQPTTSWHAPTARAACW